MSEGASTRAWRLFQVKRRRVKKVKPKEIKPVAYEATWRELREDIERFEKGWMAREVSLPGSRGWVGGGRDGHEVEWTL